MKVRAAVKLSRNDALQAVKELTVSLLLTRGRADTTLVIKTERVINTDPIPPPYSLNAPAYSRLKPNYNSHNDEAGKSVF